MARCACVLKRSVEYGDDYVKHLRDGLSKQGHDLAVIEDPPWPGWWSKMALFDPAVTDDLLYFDLDTIIVGPIDDLLNIGKLTMLADFNLSVWIASGVMYLPECDRAEIWETWMKDPAAHMLKHRPHGDGGFLSQFWKTRAARWQIELPGQVVSYKKHVRYAKIAGEEGNGNIPEGARVVAFHGRPRPRDLSWRI